MPIFLRTLYICIERNLFTLQYSCFQIDQKRKQINTWFQWLYRLHRILSSFMRSFEPLQLHHLEYRLSISVFWWVSCVDFKDYITYLSILSYSLFLRMFSIYNKWFWRNCNILYEILVFVKFTQFLKNNFKFKLYIRT